MCGIAGFFLADAIDEGECGRIIKAMTGALRHRGPDDEGRWMDVRRGIVLGHRRLSILDLSPAGHQPMSSRSGRYQITFNGEIYNHLELRAQLRQQWIGTSDTETILACVERWGFERTLKSLVGMFAIAVWDREECCLFLARDRFGEKPLYYGIREGRFAFASELRPLRKVWNSPPVDNSEAIGLFLRYGYIPSPLSIWDGVYKLPPGCWTVVRGADVRAGKVPQPTRYWSIAEAVVAGHAKPFRGAAEEAREALRGLLEQSVRGQLLADVPVGAFLSGGIDSSLIVSVAQRVSASPVSTFSMGVADPRMDESAHAARIAKELGTDHHEFRVDGKAALEVVDQISDVWDEPFADSSQLPAYLLSGFASRHVKVVLSGDGGDEFFLGYNYYRYLQRLWRARHLGLPGLPRVFEVLAHLPLRPRLVQKLRLTRFIATLLEQRDPDRMIETYLDRYRGNEMPWRRSVGLLSPVIPPGVPVAMATRAGLRDAATYLADDILVKVDRAAMSHSLESRAPLLDHRIFEFSCSLPEELKLNGGKGKVLLRRLLADYIPSSLFERPKQGFSVPVARWLRTELRDWASDLLAQSSSVPADLDMERVREIWREHQSGFDHSVTLWAVLMLLQFRNVQASST